MKVRDPDLRLELPADLRRRLFAYRHRVWQVKMAEAALAAAVGLLISYLCVFALDRLWDTPAWLRTMLLFGGVVGFVFGVPTKFYRWVWRRRRLADVASLFCWRHPRLGDQLLGTVELVAAGEQSRASPALCRAAIEQVAERARGIDFRDAVPNPRHRGWALGFFLTLILAAAAFLIPDAGTNAFARWFTPWKPVPRYTFARIQDLPARLVVAIGEPFTFQASLHGDSRWKPATAKARYGNQAPLEAKLLDGAYRFDIPPQTEAAQLHLRVGDAVPHLHVAPLARPELVSVSSHVELPAYLEHSPKEKDARAGAISVLKGCRVVFEARATRQLVDATVRGTAVPPSTDVTVSGDSFRTPASLVSESSTFALSWLDVEGLSAKEPFEIRVAALEDDAPTIRAAGLSDRVVLVDEVVTFRVLASDDFGVRAVGAEWSGVEPARENAVPEKGEYLLAAGGPEEDSLDVQGTFHAKGLGIAPQPIHLRLWAEDYLPDRGRIYTPIFRVYVLSAEEHMIWITERMKRWERQVLEVGDEEKRLFARNRELNDLSADELAQRGNARKVERQAALEIANAQRLRGLTKSGEQLVAQAARNEEFNAATLERWAEMLRALKDIGTKRMPSVASLLAEAVRSGRSAAPPPQAPSINDLEAGPGRDATPGGEGKKSGDEKSKSSGRLGLPTTTVMGPSGTPAEAQQPREPPPEEDGALVAAVEEQEKLLAEFERVMGEIANILKDLYGSTFVKRLKHAARREKELASALDARLQAAFGSFEEELDESDSALFERLALRQTETATQVSYIEDDLHAFFQRTKEPKFSKVHKEMRSARVVASLQGLSYAVEASRQGETIAQSEYWVDQLDRWAEILIGPG